MLIRGYATNYPNYLLINFRISGRKKRKEKMKENQKLICNKKICVICRFIFN